MPRTGFDDLYSSAGTRFVKAPTAAFTSHDIGTGFDGSAKYVDHKYFGFQAGVGRCSRARS
jgi:hypothetical protein